MDARKRKKLEAAGWQVGSGADFLALSAEEAALVETRLAISSALRQRRQRQGVTQAALAKKLRSSQSRVAKMEAGDPRSTTSHPDPTTAHLATLTPARTVSTPKRSTHLRDPYPHVHPLTDLPHHPIARPAAVADVQRQRLASDQPLVRPRRRLHRLRRVDR